MSSDQCEKDETSPNTEKKKTQDNREMRLSGEVSNDVIGVHERSNSAAESESAPPRMACNPSHWMMYCRS